MLRYSIEVLSLFTKESKILFKANELDKSVLAVIVGVAA